MSAQGCTNCNGQGCGMCCGGKWKHKRWARHAGGNCGGLWVVGWMFTIAFLKLSFWKSLLAIIVWPYFLGGFFAR